MKRSCLNNEECHCGKPLTYKMIYTCSNCKSDYEQEIGLGLRAQGRGGQCPYCGISDNNANFAVRKPEEKK